MGGVSFMKTTIGISAVTALLLLCQPALGFQETTVTPPSGGVEGQTAQPMPEDDPATSFSLPDGDLSQDTAGTEVSIPGLGRLGVIPKLDFGLELLYGAAESESVDDDLVGDDEITIRGRVKHKF